MVILKIVIVLTGIYVFLKLTNVLSYTIIKNSVVKSKNWDLNICCGNTDGGGVNCDIVKHRKVNNFILIEDIYNLPFKNKQFEHILCSHTVEHIENPSEFISELNRVGEHVTILIPPIWDLSAAFNFLEHKWLFFSLKSKVIALPKHIRVPFSQMYQKRYGQKIKA